MQAPVCDKVTYPPLDSPFGYCKNIWIKARESLPTAEEKIKFADVPMIYVQDDGLQKTITCYNDDSEHGWHKHGWCNLEGSTSAHPMWGICSPSCKYIHKPPEEVYRLYYQAFFNDDS